MKHRITEAQLRKLVYSQVKRLAEAEQLSLPGMGSSSAQNQAVSQAEKKQDQTLDKILNKLKPALKDDQLATQLAAALKDVKGLESGADKAAVQKALSTTDQGALARFAVKILTGEIVPQALTTVLSDIKMQATEQQKLNQK